MKRKKADEQLMDVVAIALARGLFGAFAGLGVGFGLYSWTGSNWSWMAIPVVAAIGIAFGDSALNFIKQLVWALLP